MGQTLSELQSQKQLLLVLKSHNIGSVLQLLSGSKTGFDNARTSSFVGV
jgi:hypothetical protein